VNDDWEISEVRIKARPPTPAQAEYQSFMAMLKPREPAVKWLTGSDILRQKYHELQNALGGYSQNSQNPIAQQADFLSFLTYQRASLQNARCWF